MANVIQSTNGTVNLATVVSPAWNSTPVAGNAIIVPISWNTAVGTVSGVADTQSNAYAALGAIESANSETVQIWGAFNIAGGAAPTVTVTLSAAQSGQAAFFVEVSGLKGTVDAYGVNSVATGASPHTVSVTTIAAYDFLIGVMRGGAVTGIGVGWTALAASNLGQWINATAPGSYTASWSVSAAANFSAAVAALTAVPVSGLPYDEWGKGAHF